MSARTEAPTPRRLREARRRGEVARSRELPFAVGLLLGLATTLALWPWAVAELSRFVRSALVGAPAVTAPFAALDGALCTMGRVAAPFLLVPTLAAGAVAAAQSGPFLSFEPLRPRLDRLSPAQGLRRLLSPDALLRTAIGVARGAIALGVLWGWVGEHGRTLGQLPRLGVAGLWRSVPVGSLALRLAAAALAFGALDLALARRRHRRALMMTREEVRREAKEDEGEPQHRAERRRLHRSLAEAAPLAKATVVVVNPTHFAVALEHRRDRGDEAPRILAKAAGADAARVRSAARRAGVPIVRDVPLARALFRLGEVGEEIPVELYDAAAAVLVHVHGLGGNVR